MRRAAHRAGAPPVATASATSLVATLVAAVAAAVWWRWAAGAAPGSDARLLLAVARRVADGAGPRLPDGDLMTFRGPGWPAVVGILVRTFGDHLGVALAQALAAAALAVALVALGRRWYGWGAGLTALLLASGAGPVQTVLADWYADPAAIALGLAGVLALDAALRDGSGRRGAVAGVLLVATVLTKESAGFVAVGPVAAAVATADRDGWGFLRPLAVVAAVTTVGLGPWLTLHVAVEDRFFLTLVEGTPARWLLAAWWSSAAVTVALALAWRSDVPAAWPRPSRRGSALLGAAVVAGWAGIVLVGLTGGVPGGAVDGASGPGEIVRRNLLPAMGSPLFVLLGVGFLIRGLVRRERPVLAHTATLAAYVPVLVVWPLSGSVFVARNGLVAVLLVHLAAGAAAWRALRRAASRARAGGWPTRVVAGAAASTIGALVLAAPVLTWRAAPDRAPDPLADLDATAAWLRNRLGPGEGVVGSYLAWARLGWRLPPGHPVHLLPSGNVRVLGDGRLRSVPVVPVVGTPRPVVVPPDRHDWILVLRHPTKGFVSAVSRARLARELRRARARHLVLWGTSARDRPEFVTTLVALTGVRRVATFGEAHVLAVDVRRLVRAAPPPAATDPATIRWIRRTTGGRDCTVRTGPVVGWPPRPSRLATCGPLVLHTDRPAPSALGVP